MVNRVAARLVWLPNRLGGALSEWNCDTHDWHYEGVAHGFNGSLLPAFRAWKIAHLRQLVFIGIFLEWRLRHRATLRNHATSF